MTERTEAIIFRTTMSICAVAIVLCFIMMIIGYIDSAELFGRCDALGGVVVDGTCIDSKYILEVE